MIQIGKVVNTHGIKGEIRIFSNFKYKSLVFNIGNHLYINNDDLVIRTYRVHKNYDMVSFENINDINDVLKYKGKNVYIKPEEYVFPDLLNEDLIGLDVYDNGKLIGVLSAIKQNVNQELLVIKNNDKEYLIPYVEEFIQNISKEKIELNLIEGLLDED
ncbi:MAG: 16S rRNA processing protein RimM [Bacilli bacterium]|nr:16S rRNA processing protein RimM [Bacilli bacterium]